MVTVEETGNHQGRYDEMADDIIEKQTSLRRALLLCKYWAGWVISIEQIRQHGLVGGPRCEGGQREAERARDV